MPSKSVVPGVVIHHVSSSTRRYVGCPSIVELPDGELIASHSHFGPGAENTNSYIYSSVDAGESWQPRAKIVGQIWSNLFLHDTDLYILGTDHCDISGGRFNGRIVIRRSTDRGRSWSLPTGSDEGLLTDEEGWHTAPCPVVAHRGRIWRAMEYAPEADRATWRTVVMSISVGKDLLRRSSWRWSEQLDHRWSESQWIEGNMVVAPDGSIYNLLRENYRGPDDDVREERKDRAILVQVADDGLTLKHDPAVDSIEFPGGGTKFTIRIDEKSRRYWALVNKQKDPPALRNRLYLTSSSNLREWQIDALVLEAEDQQFCAFQYVDWQFSGEDLIFVSRTAFNDGEAGAHSFHDANFLTFHRIHNFRKRRQT